MDETIVLFSGGSDSTLAAAIELEASRHVHLLTFDRISFIGANKYTHYNYKNLQRIYGQEKITRKIINIDKLHSKVCYANYLGIIKNHGTLVASLSFSKIAMHWAAANYALKNGIKRVVDGSVPYMNLYPDQNQKIAKNNLVQFYSYFEIEYATPVYEIHENVEQHLYDRGIITRSKIRGTDKDFQVYYLEQVLLALFLKYYLSFNTMDEYEHNLSQLYHNRLNYVKDQVENARQ